MDLFGIGPLELIFIILIIIIIFSPKDIAKTSKTIGKSLNKIVRSDTWKTINQTSRELRNLPTRLMRESGLEEMEKSSMEEFAKMDGLIQQSSKLPQESDSPPSVIPKPNAPPSAADDESNPERPAG